MATVPEVPDRTISRTSMTVPRQGVNEPFEHLSLLFNLLFEDELCCVFGGAAHFFQDDS